MRSELEKIVEEALRLPSASREVLAHILLESLDHEEDFIVSAEWRDQIQRRCREIDDGEVSLVSAEEAFARLDHRFS